MDMNYNFGMVMPRLKDSFDNLDREKTKYILGSIRDNCICIGTGGSNAVSLFASKVLEKKDIIAISREPRDVLYMNLKMFRHLLGITYSNNNYGINQAISAADKSNIIANLLTAESSKETDICYKGKIEREKSFISIASTIIPMSVLLNYYLDDDNILELIENLYSESEKIYFGVNDGAGLIEIMSGDNTTVAANILESTIAEAGLGIPVVHEKYGFCHGRSTLIYTNPSSLIYLINGRTNIDDYLLKEIKNLYRDIIVLETKAKDKLMGEFDLSLKSLFLCREIARIQNKDLSLVNYSPVVKKLYRYNGGM